jgi:transposase-like protein
MLIQLHKLLDVAQCYEILRNIRRSEGVFCPNCSSNEIVKNGKDLVRNHCQHYRCKACRTYFDDLTDTAFSGSHQKIHHGAAVRRQPPTARAAPIVFMKKW